MMNMKLLVGVMSIFLIWCFTYYSFYQNTIVCRTITTFDCSSSKSSSSSSSDTILSIFHSKNQKTMKVDDVYSDMMFIEPISDPQTTIFYAHGDVPYTRIQARKLLHQMQHVPSDAEFMIHLGDIRMAGPNRSCTASDYSSVSSILQLSPVPVFIIVGDNDIHDCPNYNEGLQLWMKEFHEYENQYWDTSHLNVRRPLLEYPNNFIFQYNHILFIGVHIVGEHIAYDNMDTLVSTTNNDTVQQLTDQVEWVIKEIRQYHKECLEQKHIIGRVVLFYHANPGPHTRPFFKPLRHYIGNELNHSIPILFMNGDAHRYMYQPRFYNETSLLRITVTGLAVEPLLQVSITSDGIYHDPTNAFVIDRRLPLQLL